MVCRKHFIRCYVTNFFFFRVMLNKRLKKTMLLLVLLVPQVSSIPCDVSNHNEHGYTYIHIQQILAGSHWQTHCTVGHFSLTWLLCVVCFCVRVTRWRGSKTKRQEAQKWEATFASAAGAARLRKWNVNTWKWTQNIHTQCKIMICSCQEEIILIFVKCIFFSLMY